MTASISSTLVDDLNEADFAKEVEQSPIPVFLDFHAVWCGPCKALAPLVDALAETYEGKVRFFKVDIDSNRELAQRLNIRGVPSLVLFQNGKIVEQVVGARHKAFFVHLLNKHVQNPVFTSVPARAFRAFDGNSALHEAVVARVRHHIGKERVVPRLVADVDTAGRYCTLMGAAMDTADVKGYERALGIPTIVGQLQQAVHELLIEQIGTEEEPQYRLRSPHDIRPLEWWQALSPGRDLQSLPAHFIHWFLLDLMVAVERYESRLSDEARSMTEAVAKLHVRSAQGNVPVGDEWEAARTALAGLRKSLKNGDEASSSSNAMLALEIAEQLAWPVAELDEALICAISTRLHIESGKSVQEGYTAEQWVERERLMEAAREKLENAISEEFPSREGMTADKLLAMEEYQEAVALHNRYRPIDEAQLATARLGYGEHLHAGLMQALAETVSAKVRAS